MKIERAEEMLPTQETYRSLVTQNEDLQSRLQKAEEVINTLRHGGADAGLPGKNDELPPDTLKSADHTFRIFIEKMNDGALTLNRQGTIVYCNSSLSDMLGIPFPGLLGQQFIQVIPAEHKKEVGCLLEKAWHSDSKAEITFARNGKPMPVMLSLSRLEIDGGESLSIIITDLSFQKEAQQQRKTLEQKDEFISIASHELKTPVTTIKGYIQLLRFNFKEEGNHQAEEMLARADAHVNKLSNLISELLDVRKIEDGQLQYNEESFDLTMLVKEMVQELLCFSRTHKLCFTPVDSCTVHGDRHKISQVISNLIENAIKYSPAKSKVILAVSGADGKARFSVQDFGMGITSNEQPKIFDRFYRAGTKVENTYAGMGLGLYISAEIIKKHNGKLIVESEYGKGSTFWFELPLM